jgi:hypothetical protein
VALLVVLRPFPTLTTLVKAIEGLIPGGISAAPQHGLPVLDPAIPWLLIYNALGKQDLAFPAPL